MNLITNLIKNPKLSQNERQITNKILYLSYEKWAIKKAIEFKKYHYFKCKNVNINDLIISSKFALFQSIKKYNGNSKFIYFSEIYIKSELLKTLTDSFSLSTVPKYIRKKNKNNFTEKEILKYKKILSTRLVSYSDYWKFDKYVKNYQTNLDLIEINENKEKVWEKIKKLDTFQQKIFYLKYDLDFNKINSNKNISEIIGCSEENIRLTINKIKNFIYF
jgi:RNA polymerase sigma factor (sigma-70 family)